MFPVLRGDNGASMVRVRCPAVEVRIVIDCRLRSTCLQAIMILFCEISESRRYCKWKWLICKILLFNERCTTCFCLYG